MAAVSTEKTRQTIGLILGPLLFVLLLLIPQPEGMTPEALSVAAVALLMATWWITEAIPIPATALLPIALFPALGVMKSSAVTASYGNHLIYLFMGGFLIAVTMERWNLHKRMALHTIRLVGISPNRIVLGFMLATAFLSMWISNTATTMMMVPIALAVIQQAVATLEREGAAGIATGQGQFKFGMALMLGIAYAASIGGVATLIGSPPNAILAGVIEKTYGQTISFAAWLVFALPLSLTFLIIAWFYLTRISFRSEFTVLPGGRRLIDEQLQALGPISKQEKRVLAVFISVAAAWIANGILAAESLSMIHDSTIAIAGGLALFLIPADFKRREFLLDWPTAVKIPWDIIVLFGGGFALAQGFSDSGLTHWLAERLQVLEGTHIVMLVAAVALLVVFLTEVTSNTATASLLLPVMAAFAEAMQVHPYSLMFAAAIAASYAFMLPVATPPNAIVFASRYVTIPQMAKTGLWLNFIGTALITLFVIVVLPWVWGIELQP